MGRAPCCEKVGLKRGRWTAEEDEILIRYIQANGQGSWRSLPKNAGLLRCGKSCRLRWINYLRTDLKRGNISPEEEEIIIKLHTSFGNRWSLIAGHLPGRTDNEIKNYWNSNLSRRIHSYRKSDDGVPVIMDIGKITGGSKRRAGRRSRSAMKKNSINHTPPPIENRKGLNNGLDSQEHVESDMSCPDEGFESENRMLGGNNEKVGESYSSVDSCSEEMQWLNLDLDLDLDLDLGCSGGEEKLQEDGGEMWSWLWESDGEGENCQLMGCEEEAFAAWLLSSDAVDSNA